MLLKNHRFSQVKHFLRYNLTSMNSAERRMKLLLLLQSKTKTITVNYLADYFEVSRRTIFRDLKVLQEMEVPVTYEENEGYGIMRGYTIPPLMFNPKEIATIMIGLNFAKSQKDKQLIEDAKAVELKISNVVPPEIRRLMQVLGENVIVDPFLIDQEIGESSGDWYIIATAISQGKCIQFNYDDTQRLLKPILVVYYSDHWNVIGYYQKNNELRNFRIDKIKSLSLSLDDTIKLPKNYSKHELIYRDSEKGEVINIEVQAEVWMEFRKSCPAIINNINSIREYNHVEMTFDNLDYLNTWLLRFADKVKIRGPLKLKELRTETLKKMADM